MRLWSLIWSLLYMSLYSQNLYSLKLERSCTGRKVNILSNSISWLFTSFLNQKLNYSRHFLLLFSTSYSRRVVKNNGFLLLRSSQATLFEYHWEEWRTYPYCLSQQRAVLELKSFTDLDIPTNNGSVNESFWVSDVFFFERRIFLINLWNEMGKQCCLFWVSDVFFTVMLFLHRSIDVWNFILHVRYRENV